MSIQQGILNLPCATHDSMLNVCHFTFQDGRIDTPERKRRAAEIEREGETTSVSASSVHNMDADIKSSASDASGNSSTGGDSGTSNFSCAPSRAESSTPPVVASMEDPPTAFENSFNSPAAQPISDEQTSTEAKPEIKKVIGDLWRQQFHKDAHEFDSSILFSQL